MLILGVFVYNLKISNQMSKLRLSSKYLYELIRQRNYSFRRQEIVEVNNINSFPLQKAEQKLINSKNSYKLLVK
jgi:hypothetical protein